MNDIYDTQKIFVLAVKHLLADAKKKKGIKQVDLADHIGSTPNNLSGFLNFHRNYSEAKRDNIADFFGKTYMEMLDLGKQLFRIQNSLPTEKDQDLDKVTETQRFFCSGVKKLLSENKVKQNDLADTIGVTPQDLSSFLNLNRNYSEVKKEFISKFFEKSYLEILELGKALSDETRESFENYQEKNIKKMEFVKDKQSFLVESEKELIHSLNKQIESLEMHLNYIYGQYNNIKNERDQYREYERKALEGFTKLKGENCDVLIENEKLKHKITQLKGRVEELELNLNKINSLM